jgi:hypothetical protein
LLSAPRRPWAVVARAQHAMPTLGCPSSRARERPFALVEQNAGRFAPYANLQPPPKPKWQDSMCMRCWVLPDACLEIRAAPDGAKVYDDPRSNNLGDKLYRAHERPFTIHVGGLTPPKLQELTERMGSFIKDPLFSQILRHLERDIVWANRSTARPWARFPRGGSSNATAGAPGTIGGTDELTMVWPYWEKGYGDVIANTLLPFGELLRMGAFPRHLALSGMRHQTLIPPLAAASHSLCASERANKPLLPRCASACWDRIRICQPEFFESTRDSWRATVALDAAAAAAQQLAMGRAMQHRGGTAEAVATTAVAAAYHAARAAGAATSAEESGVDWASPPLDAASAAVRARRRRAGQRGGGYASGFAGGSVLRVLVAARHGRRLLANAEELVRACNGTVLPSPGGGTTLHCELLPAAAPQAAKIARLRAVHAYVCVWGGDTVHALHMRRGSAVVELRSEGFAERAPWSWLELHRRWVTKLQPMEGGSAKEMRRPLHFTPVLLPPSASILGKEGEQCLARSRAKQERWRKQQAVAEAEARAAHTRILREMAANGSSAPPPTFRPPPRRGRMPNETWLCYWNADLNVGLGHVLPALTSYVRAAANERMAPGRGGKGSNRAAHGGGGGGKSPHLANRIAAHARASSVRVRPFRL